MRFPLILLSAIFLLCSCARTTYVPVETVRTEYRDHEVERLVADTVRDTRFVWVKGDTVVDVREREHLRLIEVHDTCFIERTDSIPVPYPVERKLTRWQQLKIDLGGLALGALAVITGIGLIWLIQRFKR